LLIKGSRTKSASKAVNPASEPADTPLPPVLLTMANYNGTLAAVRSLGGHGIRVITADPSRLAVSAWSKYTSVRVQSPYVQDTDRFLDWLLDYGRRFGRHVLLPTSDDTAWLYALHRDRLTQDFYLSSPKFDVIYELLNKRRLYQHAADSGLHIPHTWFPETANDLNRLTREARFPVMIKPRTQVMFRTQSKGILAESPDQLASRYAEFAQQPHAAALLTHDPTAARPMVQEFFPDAATGIYNISAYVRHGRLSGIRASRKLLQQPRRLGTGVCFEEAVLVPELVTGLENLVSRAGFSGVFEAEFIETDNHPVLIDFNPRFYNQMQFDIARGLPLPLLAYYDALGQDQRLDELTRSISNPDGSIGRVYVDLFSLRLILFAQRLSGAMSPAEHDRWTEWYKNNRDRSTYPVLDSHDRLPALLAALQLLVRHARHPRNFLTSMVLNRS
jgi:predicted ATP-grasp superfamily ATP-dependent carboligase